ncbi:hypothetical protein ACLI4Z_00380 [Natrialbaceae archaeon A-arb3/5]
MSEYPRTDDEFEADERPFGGLSPSVRAIVSNSIPPTHRSLPVALCTVGAGAVADHDEGAIDRTLDPITSAVASFEGYVRIRTALLTTERYDQAADRDAAVLASDYLHSAAYAMIGETPVSDRRVIELYRAMADCSATLSARFLTAGEDETRAGKRAAALEAPLAGTAAALGTTAMGATGDSRQAIERYGRELAGAIAAHPSPTDELRETVVGVLSEQQGEYVRRNDEATIQYDRAQTTSVDSHCRRAREALKHLKAACNGQATSAAEEQSPVARLERATRIPLQDVVATDD